MKRVLKCLGVFKALLLAVSFSAAAEQTKTPDIPATSAGTTEKAMFAGGCFWCMTSPFETHNGVISVVSGYAGGTTENPTYENYGRGGHTEVVQITYDPKLVTYNQLLNTFWHQIDPTDADGQFVDRGHEYISAIYVYNDEQKQLAQQSRERLANSG
ncbi:MAG: peptide-methionine (S)-S-oxide reductase, partial [Gammaproteobacteria bacterium]|nr:peptide-methionine (S)-S-oxide reductase [Gammaproteobacteria bacterium]